MPSFILEALMTPILVLSATCDADRVLVFAMGWVRTGVPRPIADFIATHR